MTYRSAMGAAQAKARLYAVSAGRPGRPGSLRARSEAGGEPPEPTEGPRLTERDKHYLKETWRTLESDPTTVGIITFSQ
ncbi:hypothetical protein FJT64_002342 [Amphibalanus amphitrite]|uniref:Uncharacterized protein n=1 Tax=Amphibalanus amphitrite TaxID=1232801 RepID=A0A6A4WL64_AMPAM|nr:hypothetical protein FJT64_002342 [Amphibalanus amphitrite]